MRSLLALWLLFPALSMAQVPAKLGYQGRLVGAEGKPIDGKLSVKFSIFDQASGGTELWSERQDLVLADGYYSTSLGAGTRVAGDMAAAFDGKEKFLELTVQDSPPLAPRQPIDSAAYALVCGSLAAPPAGPNLLADTLKFAHLPAQVDVDVKSNSKYGAWGVFPYDAAKVAISVESPPDDLLALVQPGKENAWWPRAFNVLHVKMSPGGAAPARLLQQLAALDKLGPVTMSAYIKVVQGKLFMGQESTWQAFSNLTWVRQKATVNTPISTLGGAYGFGADPSAFTEAYIALPKVESGAVATAYVEAPDVGTGNLLVHTECTAPWSQGVTTAGGQVLCTAKLSVPWPALLEASTVGHINSSAGQRCTVGINIDDDNPPRDLCCGETKISMFGVILNHTNNWNPASTSRHKEVPPGEHTISYFLYNSNDPAGTCSYNGSTMFVRAFRR